jgi:Short C-terminal domain
MRRLRTHRRRSSDLLARPPCGAQHLPRGWAEAVVDPVDQIEELADLRRRGLLTPEEFEREKLRMWGLD